MNKILCTVLLLLTAVTIFAGCTKMTTKSQNSNDKVSLKWVFMGPGKQQDQEKVYAEFNERLKKYLTNTEVKFECYSSTEYAEKWKLMAAAGDEIDIAWTGYTLSIAEEVKKGAYLPLDDLIDKHAPTLKEELPKILFDKATYDGKIYMIPAYQMVTTMLPGMRLPIELANKYGLDTAKLQQVLISQPVLSEPFYSEFETFLEKVKKGGDIQKGIGVGSFEMLMSYKGIENLDAGFIIKKDDPSCKVYFFDELPEVKMYYEKLSQWYKKGYIRQDIQSVQNLRIDEGKKDGYIAWAHAYFKDIDKTETVRYGFPVTVIPAEDRNYIPSGHTATGNAIARTSKNPERAIKLLELLNTENGKDIYNLLVYGIEGEHYNKVSDNKIETKYKTGSPSSSDAYGLQKWVMGNTFLSPETQIDPEGWNQYVKDLNETAEKSKLVGFKIDTSNIKVEVAQIKAISKEFKPTLRLGVAENVEELLNKHLEKSRNAGLEKVRAELQRQIDEYLKKNSN